MVHSIPYGSRSSADEVLAGVDLTRKRYLVTQCDSDVALAMMCALAANGAQVIGLARNFEMARVACRAAGNSATPMACDFTNPASVAAAAHALRSLPGHWDAIIANTTKVYQPALVTSYGVEQSFLVDYIAHFALVNHLVDLVRGVTGRIVIVSGEVGSRSAADEGIMFDNLDGRRFYDSLRFQRQSTLALALYAKELSRRLGARGVAVNSLYPGRTRHSARAVRCPATLPLLPSIVGLFAKSGAQAAATPIMLAASPRVAGITGEHWADCQATRGSPWLSDCALALRLWEVSEQIAQRVYPMGAALSAGLKSHAQPLPRIAYIAGGSRDRRSLRAASCQASSGDRHEKA